LKIILVIFYKCDLNLKNFSKGGMELVLNNDELIFPYNDKEIVSFPASNKGKKVNSNYFEPPTTV
jgi:hypothetical protein